MNPERDRLETALKNLTHLVMHRSMRNFSVFAREKGLSHSQMTALLRMYRKGPCTITEISQALAVTNAAGSQLMDQLVRQNLVCRRDDARDRRIKVQELTDEGRALIHESCRMKQVWIEELPDHIPEVDWAAISDALEKLVSPLSVPGNHRDCCQGKCDD